MADGGSKSLTGEASGAVISPEIAELVRENERRNKEMFEGFNPVTGRGAPGSRTKVVIPDCPVKTQWMPDRCVKHNIELKKVLKAGSIKKYITDVLGWEYTDEHYQDVVYMLFMIRAKEDPAFAFVMFYEIVDKEEGTVVPFVLNYPQRILLQAMEEERLAGKPIRIIMPKARQFGGSTMTQLYIKWMQDFRHERWNAAIMAHEGAASIRIRAMYDLALEHQPGWSVGFKGRRLKSAPFKGSKSDFIVKTNMNEEVRNSVTTVASYENYDAVRSANIKCAHLSEVAYWKETEGKKPEGVLSSLNGTIGRKEDTIIVMESSGRAVGDFFYNMYQEAKNPDIPSAWKAMFISFYQIELYHEKLSESQEDFARWLWDNRNNPQNPAGYKKSGKFFWQQWLKGASFEAINFWRNKRNEFRTDSYMMTEFPTDDIEAFTAAGNLIFNKYCVDAMRTKMEKQPVFVGNVIGDDDKSDKAIWTAKLTDKIDDGQILRIWQMPDILQVNNRYVVSVDIGGRSRNADFTVMTVIDRLGMMPSLGGKPKVVARWRGHVRYDLLAWKAAQLAHYYQDALLVIEKNTADTRKGRVEEEGEHSGSVIDEIADYYPNMYIRESSVDQVTRKVTNIYGFHTNSVTKEQVIDNYVSYIEDGLYEEPDKQCFDELLIYERHDDGTLGNVEGKNNHDDIVMSTGIGLYVSQKMELPSWKVKEAKGSYTKRAGTEADI